MPAERKNKAGRQNSDIEASKSGPDSETKRAEQHHDHCEKLKAEIARLRALAECDVCGGTGKIERGECICGGTGKAAEALKNIRIVLAHAEDEVAKLKAENEILLTLLEKYRPR